jgi:hypothetical protein
MIPRVDGVEFLESSGLRRILKSCVIHTRREDGERDLGAPTTPSGEAERELARQAETSYKRMVQDQRAGARRESGRERDTGARMK